MKELLQQIQDNILAFGDIELQDYKDHTLSLKEFYKEQYRLTQEYYTQSKHFDDDNNPDPNFCVKYKHRSFIDIFRLCRNYHPCTLEEFLHVVKDNQPVEYYCPDIQRCILGTRNETPYNLEVREDLFGHQHGEFNDLTFNQLLELIN